jgi:hypothetical protein
MTTPAYYEIPESAWMSRDAAAARQSTDAKWLDFGSEVFMEIESDYFREVA